jgi:hypothetical protein
MPGKFLKSLFTEEKKRVERKRTIKTNEELRK